MTWTQGMMATGLTGDALTEHMVSNGSDVTLSGGLLQFPFSTDGARCLVALPGGGASIRLINSGAIGVLYAHVAVSGTPTREIGLLTDGGETTTTARYLRIGTDRKVKFYDYNGTLIASSSSQVSTNSASPSQIVAIWDCLTLGTVWVALFFDGTQEVGVDSTETPGVFVGGGGSGGIVFGEDLPAGVNCGVTMTARYITARTTSNAGDAPHTAALPKLLGVGSYVPVQEGDDHAWANGTTASPNTYQDVDETGTNDGDTSRIADIQTTDPKTAHDHLFQHSTANPFTTETIVAVQTKHIGRLNGTGKNYCQSLLKLAGTKAAASLLVIPPTLTTNYGPGGTVVAVTPSGGSWAVSDFDLSGGVSKLQWGARSIVQSGVDTAPVITKYLSPEAIYYSATLPLATTPTAGGLAGKTVTQGTFY